MALTLISSHNITSAVSQLNITSGLDDTYDIYEFHFYNLVTGTAWDGKMGWQVNAASGSNTSGYNQVIQSTFNTLQHNEADSNHAWNYNNSWDLSVAANINRVDQSNEQYYQAMNRGQYSDTSGNDGYTADGADYLVADGTSCGILRLYNPSNTSYMTNFESIFTGMGGVKTTANIYTMTCRAAGYVNAEEALDEISFKYHNGTWGSGTVYMYGVS
jgi:hypothetical protein